MAYYTNIEGCKTDVFSFVVRCSIDTRHKIDSLLVENFGYEQKTIPIIVNGIRPLSLIEFTKESSCIHVLSITKYGIRQINELCKSLKSESEIQSMILQYIEHYVLPKCSDPQTLLKIAPHIVKEYLERHDLLFDDTKLNGNYVSFIYPLNRPISRGIGALMNKLLMTHEDEGLFKERIHY